MPRKSGSPESTPIPAPAITTSASACEIRLAACARAMAWDSLIVSCRVVSFFESYLSGPSCGVIQERNNAFASSTKRVWELVVISALKLWRSRFIKCRACIKNSESWFFSRVRKPSSAGSGIVFKDTSVASEAQDPSVPQKSCAERLADFSAEIPAFTRTGAAPAEPFCCLGRAGQPRQDGLLQRSRFNSPCVEPRHIERLKKCPNIDRWS